MSRFSYVPTKDKRRAMLVTAFQKQRGRCCWCGCQMKLPVANGKPESNTATREHVLPQLFGGTHSKKNIRAACQRCNNERGNRMVNGLEAQRKRLASSSGESR